MAINEHGFWVPEVVCNYEERAAEVDERCERVALLVEERHQQHAEQVRAWEEREERVRDLRRLIARAHVGNRPPKGARRKGVNN